MVGTLDSQVIEKFKEFQNKTGKYSDLVIEDVEFENITLSDKQYFQFIKGKNKYIQKYITKNPGQYPILGSSLKNECIANYIEPIEMSDVVDEPCVSFNKDNAKGSVPFYRDYPFLMDRHHIAILCSDEILPQYLYNALITYFQKSQFGWGDNVASVEVVEKHLVPIPKDYNEKYKSIDIQKAIVEFLEDGFNWLDGIKNNIDKKYDIITKMKKSLIPSTFKRTAIQKRFRKYADENGIDFDITDIEFEIKRIHSKNKDEVICKKRMGFTPEKDKSGDLNWYKVEDLGEIDGLFINEPNTKEKTTMTLVKKAIDPKQTGKSEKLPPIHKGDILVSFKLTVGVVKIYNSNLPAYCNEAIDILSIDEGYDNRYIAYNCVLEYPKYGNKTQNGITLNDDHKAEIRIFIPSDLEKYSSYDIQKLLADFIEHVDNELEEKYFKKYNRGYEVVELYKETYLKEPLAK